MLNQISLNNFNHVLLKLVLSLLLTAFAFRLLLSDSLSFSILSITPTAPTPSPSPSHAQLVQSPFPAATHTPQSLDAKNGTGKCDIFIGEWVPDPSGPAYTNDTCHLIEDHQNCMKNGRPDSGYLYWRWKPKDCDLPRFDPHRFLGLMRDRTWAFIGDSISRNHVQSLLCLLSQVDQVEELYHDEEYRSKIWRFPSHNFTLSVIWTPFLLKAEVFEDSNGVSSSDIQLHLDQLDEKWADQYRTFDYAVIAGGKWFLKTAIYHENGTVKGCHNCPGKNLTEVEVEHVYRKTIQMVLKFVTASEQKATVILRTTTPDHFENGEWFSGGTCNRTVPFKAGETKLMEVDNMMRGIELEEFEMAKAKAGKNGVALKLLDTTLLSMCRADGHPGSYRQFQPFAKDKNAVVQNDCLHWCLPGPIDSWNDLVMELLLNDEASQ